MSSARWLISLPVLASLACGKSSARRDGSIDTLIDQADTAGDQSADGGGVETGGPPDGPSDVGAEIPSDATTAGADGGPESGDSGSDVPFPKCVQSGSLYFAAQQPLSVPGGGFEFAIAATTKGKVSTMARWNGKVGLFYVDSLDGGRSFRPAMQLSTFPFMNFRIAAGPDYIYLAAGGYNDSVVLWLAPFANLSDPSQFTTIQIGPYGNYVGQPIAGRDGRVAMFLENDLSGDLTTGNYVSTASTPSGPFSEPQRLFWPPVCAAGLYHSNGSLFMSYGIDNINIGQQMQMRWSVDNGASFSDAVYRLTSGGRARCHKLYELRDGTVLAVAHEGAEHVVGATFDPVTHQFGQAQMIANGSVICADSARTGTGRLYVSVTMGDINNTSSRSTALTFSDDDGRTWSPPQGLLGTEASPGCPELAASDDELYFLWPSGQTLMFGRAGNESACDEAIAP